jgi:segregation and condensation protein B
MTTPETPQDDAPGTAERGGEAEPDGALDPVPDASTGAGAEALGEALESDRSAPPSEQVPMLLEALLFVADGPVEPLTLARVLGLRPREVAAPLDVLGESLRGRGLRLQRGPDGVQLVTAPMASSYVEQFLGLESAKRLSTAALETLAIIAYRQPVTRAQVEAIRGVNSDAAIDTLRTRGLVDITGRADGPGRPALFATTQRFLEHFGLERPEDLPPLPEEIAGPAAARLMGDGRQLPLPAAAPQSSSEAPAEYGPGREVDGGGHDRTAGSDHEEQRGLPQPAADRGPHLPASSTPLPRSVPTGPPRMPGSGPPGGGLPRMR